MRRAFLLASAVVIGCGGRTASARDQWSVVLATDAPVPQFGDRLLVEILDSNGDTACPGCRREFGVPSTWPASFGIVPPPDARRLHVRVRLYRSAATGDDGLPTGDELIDARGQLPAPHGDTAVYLPLMMRCFGVASAAGTSCDPATGEVDSEKELSAPALPLPEPGSWAPAATRDCASAVTDGMVCIPGGAFLLGTPHSFLNGTESAPTPEHVVQLSPFAMDVDEMTVGDYRQLVSSGQIEAPQAHGTTDTTQFCTWLGANDATNDAMPVNCVTWTEAKAACASLGKRLPTEAEWEFTAGNREQETTYPWGNDGSDPCKETVVARDAPNLGGPYFCLPETGNVVGPQAGGVDADATGLGVRNLGGNLDEWVADRFSPYTAPCWTASGILVNPRCDVSTPTADLAALDVSVRGSSWRSTEAPAAAAARNAAGPALVTPRTGFRCAVSMTGGNSP